MDLDGEDVLNDEGEIDQKGDMLTDAPAEGGRSVSSATSAAASDASVIYIPHNGGTQPRALLVTSGMSLDTLNYWHHTEGSWS